VENAIIDASLPAGLAMGGSYESLVLCL